MISNVMMMQTGGSRSRVGFTEHHQDGEVCFYNIGPNERRFRLTYGLVNTAIGIGIGLALILLDVAPLWRLLLLVVFVSGGAGIFQAREKT